MRLALRFLPLALCSLLMACSQQQNSTSSTLEIPVSVENIKRKPIVEYVNTTGTTEAMSLVTLNSEMSGDYFLAKNPRTGKPFKLGDKVKKGETIIYFEDDEYKNNIGWETLKLDHEISKLEFEKQQSLYEKGGVTLRELKNAEISYIRAKKNLENGKIQLDKMKIVAPFTGVIVDLPYYTNSTKVSNNSQMVQLMDYSQMRLEINLPEKNLGNLKVGQNVLITNYTQQEDTLNAQVTELSPVVSSETRTFKGKVVVENKELKFRPGMFVKADIEVSRRDSAIVIPREIIISGSRGKNVFIVTKGAAQSRTITTGIETETEVEVKHGLKNNDRLVVKGYETLRNRSKVKIVK